MNSIDIDKSRALELAASFVSSHWESLQDDDITLNILSGGYSGRLYIVEDISTSSTVNPNQKFLIRLYGGKLIDKGDIIKAGKCETSEGILFFANGLFGLGPKLLGCFDGGRVEEFIPSHRLTEVDLVDNELSMELARKLARFHALQLPLSKKKRDLIHMASVYQNEFDKALLVKLIKDFNLNSNDCSYLDVDYRPEHNFLRYYESKVGGRLVLCHGDLNKNNILVRDKPDRFNERIMLIDYELAATDYRGIDLAALFFGRTYEMSDNGAFDRVCEYPDDDYRRMFITEYLQETKKCNSFAFEENGLDSVDHLMMEVDFFVLYVQQFYVGLMKKTGSSDKILSLPSETIKNWFDFKSMDLAYRNLKEQFLVKYENLLQS